MAENANMESDAQILWEDVVNMLEADGLAPSTLAMFKSCQGVDIDGNTLVISAGSGFVRRNVEKNAATIKAALERAAFQPMELSVGINRTGTAAQPAIPVTSTAAAPQAQEQTAQAAAPALSPQPATAPAPIPTPAPASRIQTSITREEFERMMSPEAAAQEEPPHPGHRAL